MATNKTAFVSNFYWRKGRTEGTRKVLHLLRVKKAKRHLKAKVF